MSVTRQLRIAVLARRRMLFALAAVTLSAAVACAGLTVGGAARRPAEVAPKLGRSARALTPAQLREYLRPTTPGARAPVFRDDPLDFADSVANRRKRPAPGGGEIDMSIMPEVGNHLVDINDRVNISVENGIVVAKIRNEGLVTDDVTGLAPGELGYWFVERTTDAGNPVRAYIVRARDAQVTKPAGLSFEVCHWKPTNYPEYRGPVADFVDPATCYRNQPHPWPPGSFAAPPPLERMLGGDHSTRRGGRQIGLVSWIPCSDGCCISQ